MAAPLDPHTQESAWSAEAHYTVASSGPIHDVREELREIALDHFQNAIRRFYGMRISREEIKGRFEMEQAALAPTDTIHVDMLEMIYRGKQHYARELASEEIPFNSYDPERGDFRNEIDEAYSDHLDEDYEDHLEDHDDTDEDEFDEEDDYDKEW